MLYVAKNEAFHSAGRQVRPAGRPKSGRVSCRHKGSSLIRAPIYSIVPRLWGLWQGLWQADGQLRVKSCKRAKNEVISEFGMFS